MKKVFLGLILPTLIFADTVVEYNSSIDISEFAIEIESATALCFVKKSTSDIQDGYITRKDNTTKVILFDGVSTSTVIPEMNTAVGQEGKIINSEAGFTQVETAIGLTVILGSIFLLIKTKNLILIFPILLIVGCFLWKKMKEKRVVK